MTRLKHFPSHSCWLGQSCSPSPAKGTEPGTSKGDLPCFPFIQISHRVKLWSWDLTPASFARGLCSTSARLWHQNPSAVAADQWCTAQGDILGTASTRFLFPSQQPQTPRSTQLLLEGHSVHVSITPREGRDHLPLLRAGG